jgi:hypothetical protein
MGSKDSALYVLIPHFLVPIKNVCLGLRPRSTMPESNRKSSRNAAGASENMSAAEKEEKRHISPLMESQQKGQSAVLEASTKPIKPARNPNGLALGSECVHDGRDGSGPQSANGGGLTFRDSFGTIAVSGKELSVARTDVHCVQGWKICAGKPPAQQESQSI